MLLPAMVLGACVSAKPPPRPLNYPYSHRYKATYDEVWNAAVTVLESYTIVEASREAGVLKTDWEDAWHNTTLYTDPDKADRLDEVRYRINVKLSKGLINQTGQTAVRVQINKELEKYGNLVTQYQRIPTDSSEEKILLYRIGQRLKIARAIEFERRKQGQD